MNTTTARWFAFLESNTTGTGRQFCAAARARGMRPVLLTRDPDRYPYVVEDAVDTLVLDTADLAAVVEACGGLAEGSGLVGIASSSEYFVADAARAAARAASATKYSELEAIPTRPEPSARPPQASTTAARSAVSSTRVSTASSTTYG